MCILTQGSDDLAHDAFTGNMLCMVSSLVFAVYLIVSKKLLEEVGVVTMMKYIFGGAAVMGLIVSSIIGWDAPLLTDALHGEWHWVPWAVLAFVLVFPTYLSYFLVPVGLKLSLIHISMEGTENISVPEGGAELTPKQTADLINDLILRSQVLLELV